MPSRNVIKQYVKNGIYHIYNRGVEKRVIFLNKHDVNVFKRYLKEASADQDIEIISKAIIKNHFHLLIKQRNKRDIVRFMTSLGTRYTLYFNYKYNRVGRLFQGTYKARLKKGTLELETIKKYIENNKKDDLG